MKIAVLAHNEPVLLPIRELLAAQGIEVSSFATRSQLAAGLEGHEFGAILLEGPDDDLELAMGMLQRRAQARTAIVIVGQGGTAAITHALMRGADDYVFAGGDVGYAMQRIIARIGAKVQRQRRSVLRLGHLELDVAAREIVSADARVSLSTREVLLARLLFENAGRVVPTDRLCVELCGASDAAAIRSLNQHVYQLRRKLARLPGEPDRVRIEALYGIGYRLSR